MLPSWRLALNALAGRKTRTGLMIGAVALSVSLVVMVTAAIGSVQASVELALTRILGAADVRVIHQFNSRFEASLLETIRAWPEVDAVTGRLLGSLTLVRADGRIDPETERPYRQTPLVIGIEPELEPRFREVEVLEGRRPAAPDEIFLGPLTAEKLDAAVGDVLMVQRFGPPIELTVCGIYDRRRLGTLQRMQCRLDRRTLGDASGRSGQLTSIAIILKDGEDIEAFCAAHSHEVPESLSLEPAVMIRTGFDRRVEASRLGMIIGSILTFLSASFIVVTGMTTAVTERQREMAVIRCLGGRRRQLFLSQIFYGLLIGGFGALVGVPLGLGLAAGLVWYFRESLPAGLHPVAAGIGLAVIGAVAAGLLGAIHPAWQASRVSPLRAMARTADPVRLRGLLACAAGGLACIGIQLLFMTLDDPDQRFWTNTWLGLPLLYLGYFLLAVPLLAVITGPVAALLTAALRLPPQMLARSIRTTPYRYGCTAGALMVGISILVADWSNMESLLDEWVSNIRFADGFAYRTTGISLEHQQRIEALPFVEQSCAIGYLPLQTIGRQVFGVEGLSPRNVICVGFDPARFFAMNKVDWHQGNPETAIPRLAEGDAVLVADRFLIARNLGLGDTLTLGAGRVEHDYEIVGVVSSAGLDVATEVFGIRNVYTEYSFSCVFMDFKTVIEHYKNDDALMVQVNLSDTISDKEAGEQIMDAAPGVLFRSGRWIQETINEVAYTMLAVQSTVAFCALVLACLGVGNVMLANLHSRRFEYGVMRAVGGGRAVLLRLILAEATLLGVAGSLTGTILGLQLAWVGTTQYRDLAGLELTAHLPVLPALIGWSVLILMTLLATIPGAIMITRPRPAKLLGAGRG